MVALPTSTFFAHPLDLSSLCSAITENAPLPIATVEGSSHIVRYVNPAFCKLMDKRAEQLIGKPFAEIIPETGDCLTVLDRVYLTGSSENHTEQQNSKQKNSNLRPVFWSYTMWPVVAGDCSVGVVIQVNESATLHEQTVAMNEALMLGALRQHELTEAAEKLNKQLQAEIAGHHHTARELAEKARLVDLSDDAIIVQDLDDKITSWNKGAEELYGWTSEEVIGQQMDSLVQMKFPKPVKEIITQLQNEGHFSGEVARIARDGRRIAALCRWVLDRGTQSILTSYTDITERKRAERELSEKARLLDLSNDAIIVHDFDDNISLWNKGAEKLYGWTYEEVIGKRLHILLQTKFMKSMEEISSQLHSEGYFSGEVIQIGRDGRQIPSLCRKVLDRGTESILTSYTDISERKHFEAQREAHLVNEQTLRLDAEAANRSKDLFLATLSHEVRTPLNAILGWATILRSGKCEPDEVQEGMEVIERNCRIQAKLIEDVLDISRIVSGKLQLQIGPGELVDVINAAIDVVRPAANAKGIRIDVTLDPAASNCSCDVNRMQQVVWNLLTNAIKFTPPRKTVRITLTRERSAAKIQVSDEGQGISSEFLPFVFDRFRQADSSTQRKFGGLGLGLSIVKHIVEMHGGTVQAASAGEGQGATFTVNLPVRAVQLYDGIGESAKNPDDSNALHLIPVRLDGLRVLVVDDEADARRLLVKVLGEAGAMVTAAGSVPEALAALATANPHVLVSDIAMPTRDGYDLIRQVRGMGLTVKELPAVALTAFAHKEDRLRILLAGFQMHIAKPIDPHDLTAVIATLAGRTG